MEGAKKKGNPFSFLSYMFISPAVLGLSASYFLFGLEKEMHDMRMTLSRTVLKMSDTQTAQMLMMLGLGTFFGGLVTKKSIDAIGNVGHNLVASASLAARGIFSFPWWLCVARTWYATDPGSVTRGASAGYTLSRYPPP